ncbi:TPA: hypothetical protein DIC39_02700 [Patescibacteria group bacterium]|nr:MAG: iron homeostasis [Parcubacteria group bacterium GW2011_GWA2_46_39]HBV33261.1 hypothetical protein [Patescibacteria group bacterium]HCU47943.1 hypothetical protein [Patescibacteria group bacterium]
MDKSSEISKIKEILAQTEPYVVGHGGHLEFVSWQPESGVVEVKLEGACETCVLSEITIKFGLAEALQKQLPQVKEVKAWR